MSSSNNTLLLSTKLVNCFLILSLLILLNIISLSSSTFSYTKQLPECSYYYNLDRSIELLNAKNNTYTLFLVSSSHENEFLPINKISSMLNNLSEKPIELKYFCRADNYNKQTKFILVKDSTILLYKKLYTCNDIMLSIKIMFKDIILAQTLYELYNEIGKSLYNIKMIIFNNNYIDNRLIDRAISTKPVKVLSENTVSPLLFKDNTLSLKQSNKEINPLSVNLLEIRNSEIHDTNKKNTNSYNDKILNSNEMIKINNRELGILSSINTALSSNFVQMTSQSTSTIDKGSRFLYTMIILVCVIASLLVLIKFSLEWATTSRLELNKINDMKRKGVLEKFKAKNTSIARIDMNL